MALPLCFNTACIFVSDDDPDDNPPPPDAPLPPPPAVGFIDAAWILEAEAGEPCAAVGATTAQIVSKPAAGDVIIDKFDCVAGQGTTGELPVGTYEVWIEIRDGQDILLAQSDIFDVTLTADGETVTLDATFPVDAGFLHLTWNIVDDQTGTQLACDDPDIQSGGVSVLSTLVGTDVAVDDIFDCPDFEATTGKLPLGTYTVDVSLLDQDDVAISDPVIKEDIVLDLGNEIVDIGNFEFALQ